MRRNLVVGSLVITVVFAYVSVWFYKSLALSEAVLTREDQQYYEGCHSIFEKISSSVSIPASPISSTGKAMFCELRISFLMKKYLYVTIYGVTDLEQQNVVSKILQQNSPDNLLVKLVIFEKENWKKSSSGDVSRGDEKKILERWIDR
ncbi:hypothetical protein AZI85_14460 [Bdellovibrio bacteriovorus]|uniref:Uncharacterized protein n=1 Tax=Bdellovibrio bacteriovorus TaxID=959 RepID=A0A150WV23_BDEBC|nr:hypothetical protein [Bdellovibrio bacteriovorus]KYG70335.1 hypothetical protein AZI85_14460 [Bdellovibrio bacteriovorus]